MLNIRNSFSNIKNVLSFIKDEFLSICNHVGLLGMPLWTTIGILLYEQFILITKI